MKTFLAEEQNHPLRIFWVYGSLAGLPILIWLGLWLQATAQNLGIQETLSRSTRILITGWTLETAWIAVSILVLLYGFGLAIRRRSLSMMSLTVILLTAGIALWRHAQPVNTSLIQAAGAGLLICTLLVVTCCKRY